MAYLYIIFKSARSIIPEGSMSNVSWQEVDFEKTEKFLVLSGKYQEMYSYALFGEIIKFHAKELGIDLTDEALQAFSNQARRALGLHKKEDFDKFLEKAEADYDIWENVCENELCRTILRNNFPEAIEYIPDAWPIIKSVPGVKEAVCDIVIAKGINAGIDISEETIQEHSDNLRRISGLHKKGDMEEYLRAINLDYEGWEKMVKAEIYRRELISKNIPTLTSEDLALNQYISASISTVLSELVFGHFIKTQSEKLGISVTNEELQNFLNDFRRAQGLHSAKLFESWLSANGMSLDDFEIVADLRIRTAKFKESKDGQINPEKIRREVRLSVSFIDTAMKMAAETNALKKESIASPSDEELQKESDSLRRVYHLHSADQFKSYLKNNGLSADCWQDFIEHRLQVKSLKNKIASDDEIISYLEKNKVLRKMIKDEIFNTYVTSLA